jgi:glycosyltransferase involved in cell wall biosynthesis
LASKKQTVLVVIPALNEGPHIAKVIKTIPNVIKTKSAEFKTRVLVIDDGSIDDTAAEARAAGAIVLSHVVNTGAGGATRTGMRFAERHVENLAYVVTIDGDGQHASRDIKRLVEHAVKHDSRMIVGSRLHAGNKTSMPVLRRLANWAASLISRVLFGIKTKDTQSGLRLYHYEVLSQLSQYTLDRYGFCTESLWHAVRHNIRVDELPISVSYSKEGMAKGQSLWSAMEVLRDLVRVRIAG